MRPELTVRTLILAMWLTALILAGAGALTVPLALAIILTWAAPMVRDRRRPVPVVAT
ncbi:hypothetical protein [Actinoplanes sp. CA-252034]|uniref:hypothetical protein n=1 Tax=Actinoplanes sp. CA-252034 TaxID=3239906 RepID=UPI003D982C06